jgi:hypothetical protein
MAAQDRNQDIVIEGETWRDIPGFPDYQASTAGRVRSFRRGRPHVLSTKTADGSYLHVALRREGKSHQLKVASLVALTFLGPRPDGMQVCHGDGNKRNDALENLRYDTQSENNRDIAINMLGFSRREYEHIIWSLEQAMTPAQDFPDDPDYQPTWEWEYPISSDFLPIMERRRRRAREIRALRAGGLKYREIAERYGLTVSGVCRICCGNRFAEA